MGKLTLKNHTTGSTPVDNEFIDQYMTKANGEYVKVYLLLLRHLNTPDMAISISALADCLEVTERDILRALKYWEKAGLLCLEQDDSGKISGIEMRDPGKPCKRKERVEKSNDDSLVSPVTAAPAAVAPVQRTSEIPSLSSASKTDAGAARKKVRAFPSSKELKQLYFVAEQYLGKTLSRSDMETINYFSEDLCFSADLIEYLIEYCVDHGHKSMHYIQSVALAWSDDGIASVEDAKTRGVRYSQNYYGVLKAFGITDRGPVPAETAFINRWYEEYAFTSDIVLEACNRTMENTHKPSFDYADTILKNWVKQNVRVMADIQKLDDEYKQKQLLKQKKTITPIRQQNRFNNFEGRSYDMDSLEEQLLHTQ